ncbi:MAG: bifunctional 5,10-methylenetetrahydrofolate dehydrogenase/5,10-methenyltetrahydrofolate cyclohydrolase [Candidatus Pacebacteria bacterium]|nr:bifunctional 5,10-methylenetetrahydrofolate dehydrogenase/5,10-methenyltetrahydrofolate cyclohydrolase [Candidatus Paceibacterota bacterium]
MQILDGKKVRDIISLKIKEELNKINARPKLVIIQVGDEERSTIYVRQKKIFGEKLGFEVEYINLDKNIREEELISKIEILNSEETVNGIIVQLPLPKDFDTYKIVDSISPEKDVDGLNSTNITKLVRNESLSFIPATTKGILSLLDFYNIDVTGKKVVVVGRSLLVGRPTVFSMLNRNATVTVCHSKTSNLKEEVKSADVVIVAVGKPNLVTEDFIKEGQVIIDVGITKVGDKLVGDVDFDLVSKKVEAITPVPGGVGPMTVVSLFENLLLAYKKQRSL